VSHSERRDQAGYNRFQVYDNIAGSDLGGAKVAIIILALIAGCTLAAISAVVGITIPTAISGGVGMAGIPNCCAPPQGREKAQADDTPEASM